MSLFHNKYNRTPQDTGESELLSRPKSGGFPAAEEETEDQPKKKPAKENPFLKGLEEEREKAAAKLEKKDSKKKKEKKKEEKKSEKKEESVSKKKEKEKEKVKETAKKEETTAKKTEEQPKAVVAIKPEPKDSLTIKPVIRVKDPYHLFEGHQLQLKSNVPATRPADKHDGVFLVLLFVFGLISWITYSQRKRLGVIMNALAVPRVINQLIREENAILQRVFVILLLVFILVFSTFLYQTCVSYGWTIFNAKGFVLFMLCALTISIVYFIKLTVVSFVGYVLQAEELVKEYFYNIFLINILLGLLLLPIVVLNAYTPFIPDTILIRTGVGVLLITMIYRSLRGVFMGTSNSNFSVYHLFLYLCTLEILPMIILIKLFIGRV